jgi:hypothetical protein
MQYPYHYRYSRNVHCEIEIETKYQSVILGGMKNENRPTHRPEAINKRGGRYKQ